MIWTRKKPCAPGWYFYRERKIKGYWRTHVIRLSPTADGKELFAIQGWALETVGEITKQFAGQFAGPIAEPQSIPG